MIIKVLICFVLFFSLMGHQGTVSGGLFSEVCQFSKDKNLHFSNGDTCLAIRILQEAYKSPYYLLTLGAKLLQRK